MRSAAVGIGTIIVILFTFLAMSTIAIDSLMYQEASNACNEAIYEAELFLTEEEGCVTSNEELLKLLKTLIRPMLSHPEKYRIRVYGLDYSQGLISIGISYSWMPWISQNMTESMDYGKVRELEVKRTMIIDETD